MSEQASALRTQDYGLEIGTPNLESTGPIAFGPEGILFLADNLGAAIVAVAVGDGEAASEASPVNLDRLDTRLAAYLGCSRDDVFIRDMAIHPSTQEVYLSVTRGSGAAAIPLLIRVASDGSLSEVPLKQVPFARTAIEDAPAEDDEREDLRLVQDGREGEDLEMSDGGHLRISRDRLRTLTVTDMSYVDGVLLVAGASNEEFASTLRRIPFPFNGGSRANSLEIYHVSHGKYETASPIRTFVPYGDDESVLASYTCTPLVHFALDDLQTGTQLKGRTVAELGSANTPIDMVSYSSGGEEYLLVSNTHYPLIKIACKDIPTQEPLTQHREPVGVPRQALPHEGVGRMANLDGSHVVMIQQDGEGNLDLRSYPCSAL